VASHLDWSRESIKFRVMYKKIYTYSSILTFIVGQPLLFLNSKLGAIIFLGVLAPIIMSYVNFLIITKLSRERGNEMTFRFNIAQFIFKTIFLCLITFVGVKIIELNFKIFVPTLCLTWFVFHLVEGLYANDLIKKSIDK
tara:strand:- start:1638 stop:2057 length:420 start_codon:yes stop_codon:yes gene_type:complete